MITTPLFQKIFQPSFQGLTAPRIRGRWSPASLFASGEQGLWLDPSDLSTMFQDSSGMIPITAAGQPVGLIRDKSGRSNNAAQSVPASRPILRSDGILWWLEFDGVDDFLATGTINLSTSASISAFAGIRKLSDATSAVVAAFGAAAGANPSFEMYGPSGGGTNKFDFRIRGATTTAFAATVNTAFNAPITVVATGQGNLTAPSVLLRLNGAQVATSSGATGGGALGSQPLFIGRSGAATLPFTGYMYSLVIRDGVSDANAVASAEAYVGAKCGITI